MMRQGLSRESQSEYKNKYRESPVGKFTKNYQSNFDFRVYQKGRFQRHIREPFQWDEEEWYETDSDYDCDEMYQSMRRMRPLSKYKHDKLNRMYASRLSRSADLNNSAAWTDYRTQEGDDEVVHKFGPEAGGRGKNLYLHYDEDSDEYDGESRHKGSKHRHSKSHRPKSSTDPGPFVPYGKANDSSDVARKQTHNVRASNEVHPSALRAHDARRRVHESARAEASRNSMSNDVHYGADGIRRDILTESTNTRPQGRHSRAGFDNGRNEDENGNPIPWQKGGSHTPYIPDGTGAAHWASEYEREYRSPKVMSTSIRSTGLPYDQRDWSKRVVGASLAPNDPVGFGLSYGRRLRDQDIIPAI